jgi:hypothetical protein
VLMAAQSMLPKSPPMRERKICAFAAISLLSLSALSAGATSSASHISEADKLDKRAEELFKAGK